MYKKIEKDLNKAYEDFLDPNDEQKNQDITKGDISITNDKKKEKEESMEDEADSNKDIKYKKGEFTTFALQKEDKINEIRDLIDHTIHEAVASHLMKIKKVIDTEQLLLTKNKDIEKQMKVYFPRTDHIYKFLNNPVSTYMELVPFVKLETYITNFINLLLESYKLSLIDGKLVDIHDLKIDEYIADSNKNYYVPSTFDNNTYVKIGNEFDPSYYFFSDGRMKSKAELLAFTEAERTIIINMVKSFLRKKGILMSESEIENSMKNVINIQTAKVTK